MFFVCFFTEVVFSAIWSFSEIAFSAIWSFSEIVFSTIWFFSEVVFSAIWFFCGVVFSAICFSKVGWLVVLRLNVPVNNFSVISGRSHRFLGN